MSKSKKQNQDEKRDQALEIRIERLTEKERYKMQEKIVKLKGDVAPEATGTFVGGTQKQLPGESRKELK